MIPSHAGSQCRGLGCCRGGGRRRPGGADLVAHLSASFHHPASDGGLWIGPGSDQDPIPFWFGPNFGGASSCVLVASQSSPFIQTFIGIGAVE